MRKLIMWNIITLDGYFEGQNNWDLSFHEKIWGPELEQLSIEQLNAADYLIFGRVTYEGMAAHWTSAEAQAEGDVTPLMNQIPKIVFSRTLQSAAWQNSTLIKDNLVNEIQKLKEEGSGDIYVFGSADLSDTLIKENLYDEYRIGISPVLLGGGRPLFSEGNVPRNLTLLSTQQLSNGGVILRYSK